MTKAKATVNSDQGNQLPSKVVRLKELIVEICAGTNADYRDELSDSYAREFNAGAWAWDPIVEPVADGS